MKVVDANLLIYAVNGDSMHHVAARRWLEDAMSGDEPMGLARLVVLAFIRITTSDRVMAAPLAPEAALDVVDGWLALPPVRTLSPLSEHWDVLKELLKPLGTAGNHTSDAHLAALAIEHKGVLYSTDNDLARFRGVRWRNPLAD
jgi:uncharacterized protein